LFVFMFLGKGKIMSDTENAIKKVKFMDGNAPAPAPAPASAPDSASASAPDSDSASAPEDVGEETSDGNSSETDVNPEDDVDSAQTLVPSLDNPAHVPDEQIVGGLYALFGGVVSWFSGQGVGTSIITAVVCGLGATWLVPRIFHASDNDQGKISPLDMLPLGKDEPDGDKTKNSLESFMSVHDEIKDLNTEGVDPELTVLIHEGDNIVSKSVNEGSANEGSANEEGAAVKIQAYYRGYRCRKEQLDKTQISEELGEVAPIICRT
jgi:hypothetical protein